MTELFTKVLDMSLTGAIVTCFVILVRLALRRAPKIWSYALWGVVLFRLLCPVAFSVPAAPLSLASPQVTYYGAYTSTVSYIPAQLTQPSRSGHPFAEAAVQQSAEAVSAMDIGAVLWLCGIGVMILYSAVSYLQLRRDLIGGMNLEGNVYLADHIGTPFVLGLWSPAIYIPSCVPVRERFFILAHERHHIRRGDHILKALAWIALCIHWFNPFVWAAFILAGKDMEMSCDEAVLRQLGPGIRADYSQSLLRLASGQRIISFAPLAFGEGDTKGRVLNMANWKKPKLWISLVCVVVIIAVLAACAVNPGAASPELHKVQGAIEFGHLSLAVPLQYSHGDSERGGVSFYEGDVLVAGIERYAVPQGIAAEDLDPHELGVTVGVPDALVENLAYFGSDSTWVDMEIEYFDELEPEKLNRTHYYCICGQNVYDVWFDNNQVSQDSQILFLSALQIAPAEGAEELPEQHYDATEPAPGTEEERTKDEYEREEERLRQVIEGKDALRKCFAVLEMIQGSESYWLHSEKTNEGGLVLNDTSSAEYYRDGEDWMTTFQIPESGIVDGVPVWFSAWGYMLVDGKYFSNEANPGVNAEMQIYWSECEKPSVLGPWLATYQWNEEEITFVSRVSDGAGECILLQIDAPYPGYENSYPSYTVSFWFDGNGAFRYVEVRAAVMENGADDYHFLDRESIYTLVQTDIRREIDNQYKRATE